MRGNSKPVIHLRSATYLPLSDERTSRYNREIEASPKTHLTREGGLHGIVRAIVVRFTGLRAKSTAYCVALGRGSQQPQAHISCAYRCGVGIQRSRHDSPQIKTRATGMDALDGPRQNPCWKG